MRLAVCRRARLEQIRHIAPSLRLFVPNSLTVCLLLFFPRSRPPCGSVSCGDCTATAPTAPSLRAARPERLTADVPVNPDVITIPVFNFLPPFLSLYLSLSLCDRSSTFPALLTLSVRFSLQPFRRGPTPPQCPVLDAPHPVRRSGILLSDLHTPHLIEGLHVHSSASRK
jgi:hypothetical protein